jgi:hypothetical protein
MIEDIRYVNTPGTVFGSMKQGFERCPERFIYGDLPPFAILRFVEQNESMLQINILSCQGMAPCLTGS